MQTVLEFPAKVFVQWGAIAQEIVPYLTQRGATRDEIHAVLRRLRTRWEQLGPASTQETHGESYVTRHWRSQSARMLIASSMADHLDHVRP